MTISNLTLNNLVAGSYASPSQQIRVLSEDWVSQSIYCPGCGASRLTSFKNNSPVADFHCDACGEQYELKSHSHPLGRTIVDGAYQTMMRRLQASDNPNLLLLNYDRPTLAVMNLLVIPKHFFSPEIIRIRRPLALTARRAGWVGCNIVLDAIPQSGRIFIVRNKTVESKADVMKLWKHTLFLRNQAAASAKGWLLSVMKCVEDVGTERFSLPDLYAFEGRLKETYPGNDHVREKIRQQLQVLRDNGYLRFVSRGLYEVVRSSPPDH